MGNTLSERSLTTGQTVILGAATVPMIVFGGLGAWGTYTNIKSIFPQNATALGVVAAGEGATLVLALVMVGLTLLGQSSPAAVRVGLWLLPAVASGTGAYVADDSAKAVIFAITPMAMCVSAEGMGLLARRIVIYHTRVDMEAQRRNATTVQRLSVQWALAANHPERKARRKAELKAWRLARKVGVGDESLGVGLVTVQRERMTAGADTALAGMFAPAVTPALTASVTPALEPGAGRDGSGTVTVTDPVARHTGGDAGSGAVTPEVTQLSDWVNGEASRTARTVTGSGRDAVTDSGTNRVPETVTDGPSVTDASGTDAVASRAVKPTVTLQDVASVAGVPTPVTGERLSDPQLVVVLRHLRYREDPPLSYRQAVAAFRDGGFVGGEERIRRTWGELMSREETEGTKTAEASESSHTDDDAKTDEEDEEEAGPRP
ncbi:hypothetical protein [Streptomyces sp. A5-4]|uniref:hypothetical protein n=1 Tax=Streptomyces sp. A5-4 TaxID=3384771 RepID=UPI003DA9680E